MPLICDKDVDLQECVSTAGRNENDTYRKPFIYLNDMEKIIKILLKMRIRGSELVQWGKMEMSHTEEILGILRLSYKGGLI